MCHSRGTSEKHIQRDIFHPITSASFELVTSGPGRKWPLGCFGQSHNSEQRSVQPLPKFGTQTFWPNKPLLGTDFKRDAHPCTKVNLKGGQWQWFVTAKDENEDISPGEVAA